MPLVRSIAIVAVIALLKWHIAPTLAEREPQWQRSPWFEEHTFTATLEPNVRVHVNAPDDGRGEPARASRLIIYALPNGNTIEQTLGCRLAEGMDWHYDIQHVAAQVRLLRALHHNAAASLRDADATPRTSARPPAAHLGETWPRERIVLICAEAAGLSWPAFRASQLEANARIRQMVDDWRRQFGDGDAKVTLTGHSGGGSFMWGVIEAADDIPAYIDRIAFLDANYSFEAEKHAAKFERWLKSDDSRRLIVLAYDDREIMLDGKKVIGPTGGTFRATDRMRDTLGKEFELADSSKPPFDATLGRAGRIHFYVHRNPQNRILHTALVGDMNGLVHVETLGTPHEEKWGSFGGPRAFTKWVQPEPEGSVFPPRPADAIGGREFIKRLESKSLEEREAAIFREITSGNVPQFLRKLKTVTIRGQMKNGHSEKAVAASIEVMPDYLAIGGDDDFVRMPMTPQTAQRIADHFGCALPTPKLVDAIDAQAELHLPPHPLKEDREALTTFFAHHEIIERQRAEKPLGLLITGIKKDIILSPRIFERPQRLAIYGWRQLDGKPIQPLTIVHSSRYVDYSHGARLIRDRINLDGKLVKIGELLADPTRCGLVSDEGPMDPPRYPVE